MERRVQQRCGEIMFYECGDRGGRHLGVHLDIQRYLDGRMLGVWSIERQEALDGLLLSEALEDCLRTLGYILP